MHAYDPCQTTNRIWRYLVLGHAQERQNGFAKVRRSHTWSLPENSPELTYTHECTFLNLGPSLFRILKLNLPFIYFLIRHYLCGAFPLQGESTSTAQPLDNSSGTIHATFPGKQRSDFFLVKFALSWTKPPPETNNAENPFKNVKWHHREELITSEIDSYGLLDRVQSTVFGISVTPYP